MKRGVCVYVSVECIFLKRICFIGVFMQKTQRMWLEVVSMVMPLGTKEIKWLISLQINDKLCF